MQKSKKAYLYLITKGYLAFDTENCFIKFLVPKQLTNINRIITYEDGDITIETNYGDEYIDLNAIADEIAINVDFKNIQLILKEGIE